MFRMLKILPLLFALGTLGIFATSCGTDHSKVRVVHASPDSPAIDVAVDGKTVVTNLAFGGVSPATGYLTVTAGNRKVEVRATRSDQFQCECWKREGVHRTRFGIRGEHCGNRPDRR